MRQSSMRGALLVLPFLACAPGVPITQPPTAAVATVHLESRMLAVPGESMDYQVSLRGIVVARVQVAVGQPGWVSGRRAIIVRSRGSSDGLLSMITDLTWELTTTLDLDAGHPVESHEEAWVVIAGHKEHDDTTRSWSEGDGLHDLHSAAGAVRGLVATSGHRVEFEVGIAGARLGVELWQAGREFLRGAKTPSVRFEGIARDKYRFAVWLSDDAHRVPQRLQTESKWGSITVDLVAYDSTAD